MNKNVILKYAIGPVGSAAIGLITLPIITWYFTIEDVGRVSMLQVVASFSILLFCLGLDQAYVREYHESDNKPRLFRAVIYPGLGLMLITLMALYFLSGDLISRLLFDVSSVELTFLSMVFFITTFISRFLSLILRMEERALAFSMSQLIPKVLFFFFVLLIALAGFKKNIYSLVVAQTISVTAVLVVFAWNTKEQWLLAISEKVDKAEFNKVISFGLPLVVGGLASWGLNVMDKLFLRSMSTFSELGLYSVAASIAGVAAIFAGIFNTIWAPMAYKWVADGVDHSKFEEVSEHLLAAVYLIVVLAGLFSWVVPLFLPEQYASIKFIIIPCIMGPLLYTLSEVPAVGMAIARKTKLSMVASICAMLANALGNYLLVPHYGAMGAAISTVIAFGFFYILRVEFSKIVWRDIKVAREYFIVFVLISASVIFSMDIISRFGILVMWLSLFASWFYLFGKTNRWFLFRIKRFIN